MDLSASQKWIKDKAFSGIQDSITVIHPGNNNLTHLSPAFLELAGLFEPSHEIMALSVLRKLILQTRMRSHPVGLDVGCFVGPFVYFHSSSVRTAKALARLRGCAGSPEPSLFVYVISTIISCARSIRLYITGNPHLISSQSLNLEGRRGTTDDVATISFHLCLSSAALRESPNPIPVHSLMLSSHLFFCLPLLLAPFTVPCRIVFAMPEDLEMWPYHLSYRFFTMARRLSCSPAAFWILLRTYSFVTWS